MDNAHTKTFLGHRILIIGGSGFIGMHLLEMLTMVGVPVASLDIRPPLLCHHRSYWLRCDIMSTEHLNLVFTQFKPTIVYHLAAKANLEGLSIDDFPENTIGTENVVNCVNADRTTENFFYFSTQYVVRPGIWPETEEFLLPYTPYGESKAEAEKFVRSYCEKCWTILRPTNVWGPFHPFFPYELWKYLKFRLYLHPGNKPIIKYYSFVSNAVDQVIALTLSKPESICGRVFYITDPPINSFEWMNAFSLGLTDMPTRRISKKLWRFLSQMGDMGNRIGLKFPMTSERYFRLTVNEQVPYQRTIELAGLPKVSMNEGVYKSISWYTRMLSNSLAQ